MTNRCLTSCLALCITLAAGCGAPDGRVDDPVAGVALSRQQTISRAGFGFQWPLSVGVGTLACDDAGVILFRTQGVTYVLSGMRPGAADIQPLRIPEPSALPSHPLDRLKQSERMEAFTSMTACRSRDRTDEACRRAVLARFGLSTDDWTSIEAEGRERQWPPLVRALMPLDPLIAAGRALCAR